MYQQSSQAINYSISLDYQYFFSYQFLINVTRNLLPHISIVYKHITINMNKPISSPSNQNCKLNKFNYQSRPSSKLHDLLSSDFKIKSFEISEHGRTGVFFIQTTEGAFVMKSSNDGPKDQFLNRLAAMLNLNVPQSVCYCCSEPIFHKIMFEIQRYCEKDEVLYARLKSKLDFPFYQILQYIPSVSLAQVGKERFQAHLLQENKLYTLGMCLGYDIIINNSDRFALLWTSDGNINNILIKIEDHDIHAMHMIKSRQNTEIKLGNYSFIDHSGYLLDLKNQFALKNFEKYIQKASDFIVKLMRSISQQKILPEQFQKLIKQVEFFTHYRLTEYDLHTISHGIIYMIKKFLELYQSKAIEELYNNLKKRQVNSPKRNEQQNSYWYRYWNTELSKVNLNYLQEVYNKIAAIFTTYPQTVDKIIEHVGDIDEQVGNNNFQDIQQILDIKGETQQQIKGNQPSSNIQLPFSETTLQSPTKQQIVSPKKEPSIQQEEPQKELSVQPEQTHINEPHEPQAQPEKPKVRKWREKLQKFKQNNSSLHS